MSFGIRALSPARWLRIDPRFLPFADAATPELPLPRLLRLALFQVSVGMCLVMLTGTLNRVMIVELGIDTAIVGTLVALPLVFAPLRALLGFRSDQLRSAFGWRRTPYLWFGTLLQFGGLAVMPFALILLSGDTQGPAWIGVAGAALSFLLVGAGLHTTQTAGLALATDLASAATRARAVALLHVALLAGTLLSALVIGALLRNFSTLRLIQVLQGAALVAFALNVLSMWKQEPRNSERAARRAGAPASFSASWREFVQRAAPRRYLVALAVGTAAFAMQDVLLEPYGGAVLGMSVAATTGLTVGSAGGALLAYACAARTLQRGSDPLRLAATGCLVGLTAFAAAVLAAPMHSTALLYVAALLIGFGSGLFSLSMLLVAMDLRGTAQSGLALGAWGAVQASAAGLAIFAGGMLQSTVASLGASGALGEALRTPGVGYSFVYHVELALLFATLVLLGPLLSWRRRLRSSDVQRIDKSSRLGLAEFPG